MFTTNNTATELVESGVSVTTLFFLKSTVMQTIPWLVLALPLLVMDAIVGVRATNMRYEKNHDEKDRFTFSRLFRKSIGKIFEYISWCILGAGIAVLSNKGWAAWAVLALPFISEAISIWGHKLELQGIELSLKQAWRLIVRKIAERFGVNIEKEDAEELIKGETGDESK